MRPMDSEDPVLIPGALDDRDGARLDDEQVIALVSLREEDLPLLDAAQLSKLAELGPYVLIEPAEDPRLVGGFRQAARDRVDVEVQFGQEVDSDGRRRSACLWTGKCLPRIRPRKGATTWPRITDRAS